MSKARQQSGEVDLTQLAEISEWLITEQCSLRLTTTSYVFGWGRRFCQGSNIAEATLFITLSRLIWGIDFQSLTDPKTGTAIIPDIAEEENTWSDGFLSVPKVFDVRFNSRSAQHSTVIERVFREAQSEWQNLELKQDERD